MKEIIDRKIIESYLSDSTVENEKEVVEEAFIRGGEDNGLKRFLSDDWDRYNKNFSTTGRNLDHLLDRIHHRIHLGDYEKKKSPVRQLYFWYSSVAASLLIPLIAFSVYLMVSSGSESGSGKDSAVFAQIFAPAMSRVQFTLPDGTTGWLNSNSKLRYAVPFNRNRQVQLEGEAFLSVAHDERNPFTIGVKEASIRVLGTKLNVNGYPDENYLEVVLEEGEIEFSMLNGSRRAIMKPSEKLTCKEGVVVSYEKTDTEKYTSWKQGKLVFRGDPMEEVARRIERWYNVKVIIQDEVLKTYSFYATFDDDPLPEMLRLLRMTSPIDYTVIDRKIQPDGTFDKTIVILSKRVLTLIK